MNLQSLKIMKYQATSSLRFKPTVMPNLRRIGLLRDSVKGKFEYLGILEYAESKSDADIDWADLSRPLFEESA